jgi:hypothetical protein
MPAFDDLTGMVFSRLTVLCRTENRKGRTTWLCRCECGNEAAVWGSCLRSGHTQSCGCFQRERAGHTSIVHGLYGTRIMSIRKNMIRRCHDPKCPAYYNYGDRGISVCEEWIRDPLAFAEWAWANGYADDLMIDRIENDGNYTPENCRFVDRFTQNNNSRRNRYCVYSGKTYTVAELARVTGVSYSTLLRKITRGLSAQEAIEA